MLKVSTSLQSIRDVQIPAFSQPGACASSLSRMRSRCRHMSLLDWTETNEWIVRLSFVSMNDLRVFIWAVSVILCFYGKVKHVDCEWYLYLLVISSRSQWKRATVHICAAFRAIKSKTNHGMDYEEKASSVAERLLSYRKDESGWKICKKSVSAISLFSFVFILQCLPKHHY